ncbi:hypothetical protein GZL_01168 [Streptomyces sp. 769]|nr:hypothetical protein GZL_01168 [Streptomyces sp. 769]
MAQSAQCRRRVRRVGRPKQPAEQASAECRAGPRPA